jgi:hypothetical protein
MHADSHNHHTPNFERQTMPARSPPLDMLIPMQAAHAPRPIALTEHDDANGARRRPRSIRTLRQAALVFFGFPSPRLLAANLLVLLALRVAWGGWSIWDLAVALAVALYWPLQEWVLHIHLLHMKPFSWRGRTIDPMMARTHRAHHREPWRLELVFLPVKVLVPLIPLNVILWLFIMPSPGLGLTGMTGMAAAALLYEWVHYLTHTHYRPRGAYYRKIWRGHRLHHFKNEHYWHGFTVPLVDRLLGTDPDPDTVELSPTCRTLGRDDES